MCNDVRLECCFVNNWIQSSLNTFSTSGKRTSSLQRTSTHSWIYIVPNAYLCSEFLMYMITACSTNGLVYPWGVCKLGSNATCLLSYMAAEFNMHKYFVKPDGGTREACHEFAFCTEYSICFFSHLHRSTSCHESISPFILVQYLLWNISWIQM